jgi:hypothetical protein
MVAQKILLRLDNSGKRAKSPAIWHTPSHSMRSASVCLCAALYLVAGIGNGFTLPQSAPL